MSNEDIQGDEWGAYVTLTRTTETNVGSPTGREPHGDAVPVVVAGVTTGQGGRESRPQGEGAQVIGHDNRKVCEMQNAETVLGVLRERGRRGLPCDELYRQMFNPHLYLRAYGRLYSNDGAMTPGADGETVDGMSLDGIGRIIGALRCERYRFQPVKRVWIPKKNGKLRRWACHRGRTSSSARWSACFLRRTTSRGFPTGHTVSVPAGAAIPRSAR